jgi:linoleoyl-CoA desaturase
MNSTPNTIAILPRRCDLLEAHLRAFRVKELGNRQRPKSLRIVADLLSRIFPLLLGYVGAILLPFPINVGAIAVFALATVSMLGSWFHDVVHNNASIPAILAHVFERAGASPVGFSPKWWAYKHVRLHHKYVSNPEFDPDIQFGLLARISEAQRWRKTHSIQHIYIWVLLPFATLNMLKPYEIWTVRRFRRYSGIGPVPSAWIFLADRYIPLGLVWLPVFWVQGIRMGLYSFVIFQCVAGLLVSLVTQVQHNTSLADSDTDYSRTWPLCEQLARTTDVCTQRNFWWWLSGGTNFHIAHHLIPTLSFLELPGATTRLRMELKNLGVPYPVHATLRAALKSHTLLVRRLARRPQR